MLSRLIYISKKHCADEEIPTLLEKARAFNARNDMTGALYLSDDAFMQYLEGEEDLLLALWARIQRDPQHTDCRLVDSRLIIMRMFKGWPMTWLVRTRETDQLHHVLLPPDARSESGSGSMAGSLFNALARAAEHK